MSKYQIQERFLAGSLLIKETFASHGGAHNIGVTLDNPLEAGTIPELLSAVAGFLFGIGIPIAVIFIFIGGFQFATAGGNPEKISAGKRTITWAAIGIVVLLVAAAIGIVVLLVAAIIAVLVMVNVPAEGTFGRAKTSAAAGILAQEAPVQTEGLLIIRKSTEEILHIPDDQEVLELPLTVGQDTMKMALPANATDAEIETRPTDKPYMMCFEGKGCFRSNPGEHWDADFDFDTTIFWFQGVEPGVTMVITPIGR